MRVWRLSDGLSINVARPWSRENVLARVSYDHLLPNSLGCGKVAGGERWCAHPAALPSGIFRRMRPNDCEDYSVPR